MEVRKFWNGPNPASRALSASCAGCGDWCRSTSPPVPPESVAAAVAEGARSLAQAPLTPGASLRVEAVFPHVPANVARFALEAVPVSTESAFPPTLPSSPE